MTFLWVSALPLAGLLPRTHQSCATGGPLGVIEVVPFVVENEIDYRALEQLRRLVDDESTVSTVARTCVMNGSLV